VEIVKPLALRVNGLYGDGRLAMRAAIGCVHGIGQIERVDFDDDGSSPMQLLQRVIHSRAIELHLVALDSAEMQYLV
jgi:hypothetical protein